MEQYRLDVNKQFRSEMENDKQFGFCKRVSALFYHFYIIIFGEFFCKEKYDQYVVTFEEFCKVDDERKKNK